MKTLIVDDSKMITKHVSSMLNEKGYETLIAENGLAAIDLLKENEVDLILLDWHMPGMSGIEFLMDNKQKNHTKALIVMMTTENKPKNITEALEHGAVEYITKPFTPDILFEKIQMVMEEAILLGALKIQNSIYKFFSDYIYKTSGIVYKEKDYYRLEARIHKLMKHFGLNNTNELVMMFQGHVPTEMHATLLDIATNNETSFFRDRKMFHGLKEVIKTLAEKNNGQPIKIWSIGCSSGQEPYSIFMMADENFPNTDFEITAFDISENVLKKAESGLYDQVEIQRGLPIKYQIKYFDQLENGSWKIKSVFKKNIKFSKFNILTDIYPVNTYDIIFCRNVLIYQNIQNKEKVIERIGHSLRPGGHLVMGAGESLFGIDSKLERKIYADTMFFQKPT